MQPNNVSTSLNRFLLDLEDVMYAHYIMLSRDNGGTLLYPRVHSTLRGGVYLPSPRHNRPLAGRIASTEPRSIQGMPERHVPVR